MADYWVDLSQLRTDGARILRWIRRQGVIMCCDPAERVRVKRYLLPMFWALEEVIRPVPLVALYLYRQTDQPPSLRTTGALGAISSTIISNRRKTALRSPRTAFMALGVNDTRNSLGSRSWSFLAILEAFQEPRQTRR